MLEKDIKILWGRSGNRCAICKLELTADGSLETLGEMAHIVARSHNGPRGNQNLSIKDRDSYNNLILLCPTHHVEVDKDSTAWSIESLRAVKGLICVM
jgi:predicted restriction endonuclease